MTPDSPVVQWLNRGGEPIAGRAARAGRRHRRRFADVVGQDAAVRRLLLDRQRPGGADALDVRRRRARTGRRTPGASFVLDRGAKVSHFNYFANERSVAAVLSGADRGAAGRLPPDRPAVVGRRRTPAARARRRRWRARAGPTARPAGIRAPGGDRAAGHPGLEHRARRQAHLARPARHRRAEEARLGSGQRRARHARRRRSAWSTTTSSNTWRRQHEVIEFSYDWRRPVEDEARRLADVVDDALMRRDGSQQPVRLVAHSMGGLVARTMQLERPETWRRMMSRPGGRLLMLGTPNGGSWAPMQTLSGDDTFGNTLVAFGGAVRRCRHAPRDGGDARLPAAAGRPDRRRARPRPGRHLAEAGRRRPAAAEGAQRLARRPHAAQRVPLERAAAGRARPGGGVAPPARRAGGRTRRRTR